MKNLAGILSILINFAEARSSVTDHEGDLLIRRLMLKWVVITCVYNKSAALRRMKRIVTRCESPMSFTICETCAPKITTATCTAHPRSQQIHSSTGEPGYPGS
jgi:hypothetical protein